MKAPQLISDQQHPHLFALLWWLLLLLFCFGLYIAWNLDLVAPMFAKDRSHITKAIALLTIASSAHAAWYVIRYSFFLQMAQQPNSTAKHKYYAQNATRELPLEIVADKLRAPVETGWFLVDIAIRLGLAGTIIGFILIFSSLTGEKIVGEDALQKLLVSMSVGMGTALFTTLTGLIAATFLSVQYLVLGRQTETVIASLILSKDT